MNAVQQVYPIFLDNKGIALQNGSIYIGLLDQNPETNPLTVYWDQAGTIAANQPLSTINGMIARDGSPSNIYVNQDYSITVRDKNSNLVYTNLEATGDSSITDSSLMFATQTAAAAASINSAVNFVSVAGFAAVGDGGDGLWASVPNIGALQVYQFQSNSGARRWQIVPTLGTIRPQQLAPVGLSNDAPILATLDAAAVTLGVSLAITRAHNINSAITFNSLVTFRKGGKLVASSGTLVTFAGGFDAPPHAAIFDFSAASSGFAVASVVSKTVTPHMFGGVGNSPSTDEVPALIRAFNAACASGLPLELTPTKWTCKQAMVWDYAQASYFGQNIFGCGVRSEIAFDAGAGGLKITDLTGPTSGSQRATFYGRHLDFQVSNSMAAVPALQYGEDFTDGLGNTSVYFNGLAVSNIVCKNNIVNGGGIGCRVSGMTDCKLDITTNAGGAFYDGSIALEIMHSAFTEFKGSCGNAETGIHIKIGSCYADAFTTFDLEVLKVGFKNRSPFGQNIRYQGTFASMDYCFDVNQGGGGFVFNDCQFGGIGVSYVRNDTATDSTWGGYGVTNKNSSIKLLGQRSPTVANATPTSITLGTWYRNIWAQDAIVNIFAGTPITSVAVRDWFDTSSAGSVTYNTGNNVQQLVKAGESIQVNGGGTVNALWRPASQ